MAECESGSEAKTCRCTKKVRNDHWLCLAAQEQKQRRKKTEAVQSSAMSRWKQEKGKGQEDKRILRPEWPYIFLKLLCGSCYRQTEIKNTIPELNHRVGMGVRSWENIHAGRWHGVQKDALKWSLMCNNLAAQRSYLWELACILFIEFWLHWREH